MERWYTMGMRHYLYAFVLLSVVPTLFFTTTVEAGCLNCAPRTTVESNDSVNSGNEDTEDVSIPTTGSMRTKIRRLPDDPVDDLYIPILFGVSLDDLYPNFGDPRDGGSRSHEGFDMLAPRGTPIVSPSVAVVTRMGTWDSAGKYVETANPGGERFVYMHLDTFGDELDTGDVLQVGDLIGYVGDTGNAYGGPAHLHFEIRDGRKALDPFPRITKEFTLAKKLGHLERILEEHDDAKELAEFLVKHFEPEFIQASLRTMDIPPVLARMLPKIADITAVTARDLTLGSEGADVSVLQSMLIAEGFLDISSPTGVFGPLTQSALRAYQRAHSITPATGYFGPATRTALRGATSVATTQKPVYTATKTDELSAEEIIRIFLALGIIAPEQEAKARSALANVGGV